MSVETYLPNSRGLVRSSDLTDGEAIRLYESISFSMDRFGPAGILNTHITISWTSLHIYDHSHALTLLRLFLNRCRKWATVGLPEQPHRRRRARTGAGFVFRHVFVCECNKSVDFHSHVLARIPTAVLPEFRAWTRCCLRQLTKHYGDEHTVRIVASRERSEAGSVTRCWSWLRYLIKQLDPDPALIWTPVDPVTGVPLPAWSRPLHTLLRVRPHRQGLPVTVACLTGVSQDLSRAAQEAAGFRSALRFMDPRKLLAGGLYGGHELERWHAAQRAQQLAAFERTLYPGLDA